MRTVLEWLASAAIVGLLAAALTSCTNEARVQFQSCEEARAVGVPLPLTPGDVGWNANLDDDKDGRAC